MYYRHWQIINVNISAVCRRAALQTLPCWSVLSARDTDVTSRSGHTSDLEIGILEASLPDIWQYRVRTSSGWPGDRLFAWGDSKFCHQLVSIDISLGACLIVFADLFFRCTWHVAKMFKQPGSKQNNLASCVSAGHDAAVLHSHWSHAGHAVQSAGWRGGSCRHRLDPPLHCWRLHLHRHRLRHSRTAGGGQDQAVGDGDRGLAVWRVHDGADC